MSEQENPAPVVTLSRLLREGYGDGAWHGPELAAAVSDVTPEAAFRRPGPGRHSIAEIVLHHTWYVWSVAGRLRGSSAAPFPFEGEDWFALEDGEGPTWPEITALLAEQQEGLARLVDDLERGRARSPLAEDRQVEVVLGITCHAVYHAGQIQLVKRLLAEARDRSEDVYYIGTYDIHDPEAFSGYGPVVMSLLPKYGGEVLASDTDAFVVEGEARTMNAIIRFPSQEAALGLYDDPAYQEAKELRQRTTENVSMVLAKAFTVRS